MVESDTKLPIRLYKPFKQFDNRISDYVSVAIVKNKIYLIKPDD